MDEEIFLELEREKMEIDEWVGERKQKIGILKYWKRENMEMHR